MSVAVVSPASTAAPRQNRGTGSSAAQAYAALQQDPTEQAGLVAHPHRHRGGKASASPSSAAQASTAKRNIGGALNILV